MGAALVRQQRWREHLWCRSRCCTHESASQGVCQGCGESAHLMRGGRLLVVSDTSFQQNYRTLVGEMRCAARFGGDEGRKKGGTGRGRSSRFRQSLSTIVRELTTIQSDGVDGNPPDVRMACRPHMKRSFSFDAQGSHFTATIGHLNFPHLTCDGMQGAFAEFDARLADFQNFEMYALGRITAHSRHGRLQARTRLAGSGRT